MKKAEVSAVHGIRSDLQKQKKISFLIDRPISRPATLVTSMHLPGFLQAQRPFLS